MLLTIEKVFILKSINLFSQVSEDDLLSLANNMKEVEFKKGTKIIKEGDIGTSMYVIVDGEVDVIVGDEKITTLKEKEVFGELAALDPEPRSATIIARKDILSFKIESSVLYDLISIYPNVAKAIITILCQRIRKTPKS
jgi:CRP-like cAMP-binding protein